MADEVDVEGGRLDTRLAEAMAETFRALGDSTRVRIVAALHRSERSVGELAGIAGVSPSATSHQLAYLRRLRLVRPRRVGHRVLYRLDDEHVDQLWALALEHVLHDIRKRPD